METPESTRQGQIPPPAVALSGSAARAFFDGRVRERLGISGEEFIRRHDAGELSFENPDVRHCVLLIPFGRQDP